MHVRQDIWALEQTQKWHPVTLAYARAIGTLQQRAADDPTSWTYQGAIHSTATTPARPGWNQCQHGGWFFLPWHRLYLYYFERIIRAAVIAAGGPQDWALPYWNYDASLASSALPPPFRRRRLPDGAPNPLYVPQRRSGFNSGRARLPKEITSPANALAMAGFSPPPSPGFGGGQTTFRHFWTATGSLEQTPHNDVHVAVGGPGGLMTDPDTAALDPIFWLHHANIDRLWNRWLGTGSNANPTDSAWLNQAFQLFDADGSTKTNAVRDTLDSAGQLDYHYDDEARPEAAEAAGVRGMPEKVGGAPEMIGASDRPISLSGGAASVDVAVDARARTDALAADAASPKRLYLNIEHIQADQPHATIYGVYLQAPGGPRHHVGNVSLFGVHKIRESRADTEQEHDLRLTYDVTALAAELGGAELAGRQVSVTFEPIRMGDEAAEPIAAESPVRIGRVSLVTE